MSDEIKFLEEGIDYPKQTADWEEANCDDEITLAAQKAFGIKYLFPWQRIVIANIMDSASRAENENSGSESLSPADDECAGEESDIFCNGRQIVLLPTGAGKSLCFLTPSLLLKGPTLVLYPLLALMADQKRRMDEGGIKSVIFRGGQTAEERNENFIQLKEGARIILANPEVLQNEELVLQLSRFSIKHIAIDEAHCVSEWGDTFRPAYLTLGKVIKKLGCRVITAFTATASPSVLKRVSDVLFDGNAHIVRSDSDRQNIHYTVINAFAKKRAAFLLAISQPKPLIIFCGTRAKSEDMARELASYYGYEKVRFYHAGMDKAEKDAVEKWFYPRTDGILCCTCAFGMGVDKKDIHTVIHLEPSPTAEAYIQEAGRGGRDGSVAEAILLWSHEDSIKAQEFHKGSRERVLKEFAESSTCRRQVLLDALGGEQAACDGCDVCRRKGPAPFARDGEQILKLVKSQSCRFNLAELNSASISLLNRTDLSRTGVNIWEHDDTSLIISQLESQELIHSRLWPWKGKYSPGKKSSLQRKIEPFFYLLEKHYGRLKKELMEFFVR